MATLTDLRTLLANLNGEESAPTDASRDVFINQAIQRIYQYKKWSFRRASSTLTFTSGVATLPSDYSFGDGFGDLRISVGVLGNGDDNVFTLIDEEDKDRFTSDYYVCWVYGNVVDGFTIATNQNSSFTATLTYFKKPTTLTGSSDNCYVPNDRAVAFYALAYLKRYTDPDIDVTPEMNEAEREVLRMAAQENRNRSMRLRSPYETSGYRLGDY